MGPGRTDGGHGHWGVARSGDDVDAVALHSGPVTQAGTLVSQAEQVEDMNSAVQSRSSELLAHRHSSSGDIAIMI